MILKPETISHFSISIGGVDLGRQFTAHGTSSPQMDTSSAAAPATGADFDFSA
ncbi:MAG: hypothetical protein JO356_05940 [Acidobacteria bacterium]|nr:hypothetical protein [Acidobacteriota bacterium]